MMNRTHAGVSLCLLFVSALSAFANDTIAEWAAGGIVFKEEANVSLAREDLTISPDRVTVEYKFRNDTDAAVETTVAFPLPEYQYSPVSRMPKFDDFTVEVDGAPVAYKKQVRATVNGKDYTAILESNSVTIEDCGGVYGSGDEQILLKKLPPEKVELFTQLGLLDKEMAGWPRWTVSKTYYWPQKFPAHAVTTIKHTYTPYAGGAFSPAGESGNPMLSKMPSADPKKDTLVYDWVHYILTTANNWRGPIGEFHLRIENPLKKVVVVQFDQELETQNAETNINLKDFTPKKDLVVTYYGFARP